MCRRTEILPSTDAGILIAAELIKKGEVVGIPTETVYGLAANALNEAAVEKIFTAKGRPSDNPLIVHINDLSMLELLTSNPPNTVYELANRFWPGPLTMVLPKADIVPNIVTAGLATVAVRYPSHPVALSLIEKCKLPLAAPSANRSGSPSPTTAAHVYNDMQGKIPAVLDGGSCECGLESTVILVEDGSVTLLRPGSITPDMLKEAGVEVTIGHGVLEEVSEGEAVLSPGMKHKHYSPKVKVIIVSGSLAEFTRYVDRIQRENQNKSSVGVLVFSSEEKDFSLPCIAYGDAGNAKEQAQQLFSALRRVDELGVDIVYARAPSKDGVGLAVYNRLIRAAGFNIVNGND